MKTKTISIIGAGLVGTTIAQTLLLQKINAAIYLIDIDNKKCNAEVLDLSDMATFYGYSNIYVGSTQHARQSDIIIICAGQKQAPGQARIELLDHNAAIIKNIMGSITPLLPHAIIIIVTNPVDILTHYVRSLANIPSHHIIGTGTLIDSVRLKLLLSQSYNLDASSLHIDVIGEHGDSQLPVWSSATVQGLSLVKTLSLGKKELDHFAQETRQRAFEIIDGKGATCYGIAGCVAGLCHAIVYDAKATYPVTSYRNELGICMSSPAVIGAQGIERILPLALSTSEQEEYMALVSSLKNQWNLVGKTI
ncbi:L-lactate dehydrogenase [Candidatus Dependentiae bacterium Noda2021]|nr:L-lactate dehydrogenase [Candidatus Dependentiae bacterium Noda2021]